MHVLGNYYISFFYISTTISLFYTSQAHCLISHYFYLPRYVRALGSYYLRLVYPSLDCHKYLAPLLNDYRKLRVMDRNGIFKLTYVDQFIDDLLREDRVSDVVLPRIQKR